MKTKMEEKYEGTHDLHVSDWGPFSKKYFGISHIADQKKGLRFDVAALPAFYRAKTVFPDALSDCGVHPWEASEDFSFYSYRYEMEWKDQVYADVSFYSYDEDTRVIRCEFVNNTDVPQNTSFSLMASIEPPLVSLNDRWVMEYAYCDLPKDAVYIDAIDYEDLTYQTPRPTDNLVFGGLIRGEKRMSGYVGGSALADGFGDEMGDCVKYRFTLENDLKEAVLMVRYQAGCANVFDISGSVKEQIILPKSESLSLVRFPLGKLKAGAHTLCLTSHGAGDIKIDGFVVADAKQGNEVSFRTKKWNRKPELTRGDHCAVLDYEDAQKAYGIKWEDQSMILKEYLTDCIEYSLKKTSNCFFEKVYDDRGKEHFTVPLLYPYILEPHSEAVAYAVVTCGEKVALEERLNRLSLDRNELEVLYEKRRAGRIQLRTNRAGKEYEQGISMMTATIQHNVVFPIYVHREFIRHNTPGKSWDCLYTWDSGFIGIALSQFSKERALDILNAYMTEPGFPHAAFVHFGSPVPVQFYMFLEMMNRFGTEEHLSYFYPRLKQYYEFLAGKAGSSSTNKMGSDLLKTWDYFYNSGGWDDYPPQVYVHENKLTDSVSAVATDSHVIRIGKMMTMFAERLSLPKDAEAYHKDGERFSKAVQKYAWDEESGYFGYVVHDEKNQPKDILRYKDGSNFNKGMDGAYPLVAGIADDKQKKRLLAHLKSDKELWTKIGLSTVDQSAPYFNPCGYWNGAVWMAHQWFYYKTMLDLNETEFARKIALTALELWKKETSLTYHCYEHFLVQSGRGAGWHNFSALSGPVVNWFFYYFVTGNFTTGFEVLAQETKFNEDFSAFQADLTIKGEGKVAVILTLNERFEYYFTYQDKKVHAEKVFDGVYEIALPARSCGELKATKK